MTQVAEHASPVPRRAVQQATVVAAAIAGAFFIFAGTWAFADPSSFYDSVAEFPPYNEHFLHDIGAFQIGLGAALLLACWQRDALAVAAAGGGLASAVHTAAHIIDREQGGAAGQTAMFGIVAAVLLAIAAARIARPA